MEARLNQVLNGIARSMAPAGLRKALSFEAMRLASQERVELRLPPGLRAADGGSVGGSAEDGVSNDTTSAGDTTVAKAVGEARPPGTAKHSALTASEFAVSSGESRDTTNADVAAVVRPPGEVRPRGIAKQSATTKPELAQSSGGAGPSGPEQMATVPPLQQP